MVAEKSTGKKTAPAKKAPAKKTASAKKKTAAEKKTAAAGKAAPAKKAKKSTAKSAARKKTASAKTTGASKVVAKKSPAVEEGPAGVPGTRVADAPGELAVRPGEDPWTAAEIAEARQGLEDEAVRLRAEIAAADEAITGLMRDGGAGAGDDQADTGTKNIEREHGLALAAGARERLQQTERALERLEAGTYGLCESCGKPIGKARMQAFPRATLCVECKQRQERR
ncbi:RNA polymerase-binding transcription factor DksA [Streptomyces sp. RB5]|uniref:RNA polymerase-binding transcription factor DksA n=1 Tax=Streptomyces smaragdinus TaxID=2585196 RepID=A0A7K0CTJ2_9ACTN|nr:TraR/DksA C4-type zinc finger protein [Streptomyces smaragdinus]MQY16770.1 RNA polymerase-binding transcription factor DksA [Streptomyces smaragdinus]